MRNAARVLILTFGVSTLVACHKQSQANASANDDLSIEDNLTNQGTSSTQIETLPADESSTTPSTELNKGQDSPGANDLGNAD